MRSVTAHEVDDGRAVLLTEDNQVLRPVFTSKAEAESWLSFLGNVDVALLTWSGICPDGPRLLDLWVKEGKPSKRACPRLVASKWLNKPDPDPDDDSEWSRRWSFIVDFHDLICFPLFVGVEGGNHEVGELLERDKVVDETCHTDHESGGFYAYFDTKKHANAFIRRLNAWLRANWHRAYD